MAYSLGARSLGFITRVDPRMVAVDKRAIAVSLVDFSHTAEQSRDLVEEHRLLLSGASHTMHSHHLLNEGNGNVAFEKTPAAVGFSAAVDAVAWINGAPHWDSWEPYYLIAAAFLQASRELNEPITWGGVWGKLMTELAPASVIDPHAIAATLKAAHLKYGGFDAPHFELGRN